MRTTHMEKVLFKVFKETITKFGVENFKKCSMFLSNENKIKK